MTLRFLETLTVSASLVVLTAGCGASEMDQARDTLRNRPSIETAVTRYEEMTKRIRTELSEQAEMTSWQERDSGRDSGCAEPFSNMDGESRALNRWVSNGPITETQWRQAKEIFTDITAEYGFAPPTVVVELADEHKIVGTNDDDARYIFGSQANTVFGLITGCHWPEAKKQAEQGAAATGLTTGTDVAEHEVRPASLSTELNTGPPAPRPEEHG